MNDSLIDVVIPKENAVFWMDDRGRWHNRHGRFEHKRIIDHFNQAIRFDGDGYYVTQVRGNVREKVYFHYADTPLFVVRIIEKTDLKGVLNTGEEIIIDPPALCIENDQLYQVRGVERIKFSDRALLTLASHLKETANGLIFQMGDRSWPIPENSDCCAT
ncbi:hypothetical protein DSCO28_27540 [Desulfosarcina ovata subsp. sediminis]|uniref:MFS transporter permease n=1 Tax=Desulfosarcina ovata subsp. sediminis TaxID=885957 RepID=A0A5K7ZIX0_9BACT|nr:MFS transporter permease [Desulfosarcina ovata]BBO82188.1 hypothetical protein DSCO28_27540 [Desulfosarcina ovata subsp. sediminis]